MQPQKVGGQYQFTKNGNYEDYSSGRVLYGATGATNFPVRLTSEIFLRAQYYLTEQGNRGPYSIYDPFCGAGYSLSVLGLLHGENIKSIYASDVDKNMLEIAEKNLYLLTKEGMNKRAHELNVLYSQYHKDSHKDALESVNKLVKKLPRSSITIQSFKHNILSNPNLPIELKKIDLIISDVPYGKLAQWQGASMEVNPLRQFLNNIKNKVSQKSLIAVSLNKKQEAIYEGYSKIKSFKIGTRKILFLQTK
jgi:hypothetical protein